MRHRRLTACGVQSVRLVQHPVVWFHINGAAAPTTGERCFLDEPYLNAEMFQLFVDAVARAFPDSVNLLLLDNNGAHTARRLQWPDNVRILWLPPYCQSSIPLIGSGVT